MRIFTREFKDAATTVLAVLPPCLPRCWGRLSSVQRFAVSFSQGWLMPENDRFQCANP